MRKLATVLITAICSLVLFVSSATADAGRNIEGTWYNDLGSQLEISSVESDGTIKGRYQSAVGEAGGCFSQSEVASVINLQARSIFEFMGAKLAKAFLVREF